MDKAWMLVTGSAIVGWLLPEFIAAARVRVPVGVNVLCAIAAGLLAAYFV